MSMEIEIDIDGMDMDGSVEYKPATRQCPASAEPTRWHLLSYEALYHLL